MATAPLIYKILPAALWERAQKDGIFHGAPIDITDGYIHFSTAEQVEETAQKHFSAQADLVLLAIDPGTLDALKWEPSRGGALFPHLYAALEINAVQWAKPLLWRGGRHVFPELA